MLPNRISAATHAVAIAVVVTTASRPLHLGWLHGTSSVVLGWAAVTASLAVLIRPNNRYTEGALAGLCTAFWALRALDLGIAWVDGTAGPTPAAVHTALSVHGALFAYRSIIRLGFYQRFTPTG